MSAAMTPDIEIAEGIRLEVDGWGRVWPCEVKSQTLCFHGGIVPKTAEVRVFSPKALAPEAEYVAGKLRRWGWKNAVAKLEHGKE